VANIESKRAEIEILHEETRRACNDAESRVSILASNSRQAGNALDAVEREVVRSNAERDSLQEQATDARAKLEDLRAEGISLNSTWKEASTSLPELRRSAEEIRAKLLDARVAEASVAEQRNSVESNLRNAKQNLSRAEQRIESLLKQAAEKRALALTTNEEISRLQDLITEHRMMIVTSEAAFREARDSLDRLNSELEACRSRSEAASRHERETKEKIGSIKLSIERLQFERTNLAQNALDRYGIELSDYVASTEVRDQILLLKAKGPEARKELESDVLRLREKIRKLGEVNSAAIEEFEELTTRFQFLSEQKADLEKSMADLQSTIDKINRISKERFFRAFEEVNKQFTQVFPALFGGGQAALTLTSPDDFNETGVDIMAQPPGKKLQNINLLSGGEKTLTAISLLFAIFLVKPSPFCLLDEVDAPLDDANIGRFNALLREMARQSQFIIITHNKRTMELNDKLYGVTMEDAGVSKMVSIQLAG
jgi:chromosome segregation protein